jgi:hypothetical protein
LENYTYYKNIAQSLEQPKNIYRYDSGRLNGVSHYKCSVCGNILSFLQVILDWKKRSKI